MGRVRNKRYRLTFAHRERRWKKVFRGKPYYFPLKPGETKESSYPRVLELWQDLKRKLDSEAYDPHRSKWESLLAEQSDIMDDCKQREERLVSLLPDLHWQRQTEVQEQIEGLRRQWRSAHFFSRVIHDNMRRGIPFPAGTETIPATARAKLELLDRETRTPPQDPPWDGKDAEVSEQLGRNVEAFLEAKRVEVTANTHKKLRGNLGPFVQFYGESRTVRSLDSHALGQYKTHILERIRKDEISDRYGADLVKVVSGFLRWYLSRRDDFSLPNIILSDWRVRIEQKEVKVFTSDEVQTLLAHAPPRLKLCVLLALNCGMLASDIADLRREEVQDGRITRKRTKTRRQHNVPIVCYSLWPQTSALLSEQMEEGEHVLPVSRNTVRDQMARLCKQIGIQGTFKMLRATGSNMIKDLGHVEYQGLYLGHAPASMAEKHYSTSHAGQAGFDAATLALGVALGIE